MTSVQIAARVAVLVCASVTAISGSIINFKSNTDTIYPLVTGNLTLRCSLSDTSSPPVPVTSPSPARVGKRSVRRLDPATCEEEVLKAYRNKKDSARSVTSTPDDVMMVTAIIISRDGNDLASVIDHFTAKALNGSSGFHVTGQLTPDAKEKGHLELVWPHPTGQDVGSFRCDVDTVTAAGHSYDFSQSLDVAEGEVTIADLVHELSAQKVAIEGLKLDNGKLKQTIADMNRTKTAVRAPNVFFTAAYVGSSHVSNRNVLVYTDVLTNEGGAYSSSTGVFTSPVSGFYYFEMTAVNQANKDLRLELQKNGKKVVKAFSRTGSNNYEVATNSAIVKMSKGETMKVVAASDVYMDGPSSDWRHNTFTGQLIALD